MGVFFGRTFRRKNYTNINLHHLKVYGFFRRNELPQALVTCGVHPHIIRLLESFEEGFIDIIQEDLPNVDVFQIYTETICFLEKWFRKPHGFFASQFSYTHTHNGLNCWIF